MKFTCLSRKIVFVHYMLFFTSLLKAHFIVKIVFLAFFKWTNTILDIFVHCCWATGYVLLRLNFIIGNNIDRISHRNQGTRSIWNLLPPRDKTARITPHHFLSFLRGESYRYWFNLKIKHA